MESPEQTELRRLEDTYDLLEELRREGSVVTWLGRHRPLGRDVSITVYRAGSRIAQDELVHLAADARLLTGARHDGVVPVVESRWLSHEALAIVRARVRGSTLRRVLEEVGPLAPDRTAEVMRQIGTSLEWARRQGVVHRTLSSETVCFQQGSGRVLLSFAATPAVEGDVASSWHHPAAGVGTPRAADDGELGAALLDRCSDSQTLGMLGWEMLTGRRPTSAMLERGDRASLAVLRPDVPTSLARLIEDSLVCDRTGRDVELPRMLATLASIAPVAATGAAADTWHPEAATAAAPAAAAAMPPVAVPAAEPALVPWSPPSLATPAAATTAAAAVAAPVAGRERPRGRQLVTAGVGLLTLALITMFFVMSGRNDEKEPARRTAATSQQRPAALPAGDTATAGGEVTFGGEELTTPDGKPRGTATVPTAPPAGTQPATVPPGASRAPVAAGPRLPAPTVAAPPRPAAPASSPVASAPAPRATGAAGLAACSSPAASDQRTCLDAHLAVTDVELNRAYLQLIADLRDREGTGAGSEPATVQALRAEQRAWLAQRDDACRRQLAGREGALWAPARANCLGQVSMRRAGELWRRAERVRAGG